MARVSQGSAQRAAAAPDLPRYDAVRFRDQVMLFADAYVGSGAVTARSAESDFYHSAGYTLTPSVSGLNTVGASGHDFTSAVPEPGSALLAGLGLAAVFGRRWRRCG